LEEMMQEARREIEARQRRGSWVKGQPIVVPIKKEN
jgi:hypothetical protein